MAEKYLSSLKKLFFHPAQFFKTIESEKNYSGAMFFYVKITLISVIISFIISLSTSFSKGTVSSTILSIITNSITSIGLAFIIPFVVSGIAQLGVWIFKGKQGYLNTYKAISYPISITVIYGIITMIILLIKNLVMPINLPADIQDYALILQNKNLIYSMIISLAIMAISVIHMITAQVIGLSKFQKITKLRAFLAIIIIPLVIVVTTVYILVHYAGQLASAT